VTYSQLAVLGVAAALAVDGLLLRTRLMRRRAFWAAYAIVLACQLLANGVLTGRGVVRYDQRTIVGWRLAHAPVEDLVFGFALVLLTQATWVWLGRRQVRQARPDPAGNCGRTGRPGWPACRRPRR
jgi:lycopene cyclase domain-containing protein